MSLVINLFCPEKTVIMSDVMSLQTDFMLEVYCEIASPKISILDNANSLMYISIYVTFS